MSWLIYTESHKLEVILTRDFILKYLKFKLYGGIHRGSYMSAHVLLNLLNELGQEIKWEACRAFYIFFATS